MITAVFTDKHFDILLRAIDHYHESVNVKIDGHFVRPRKEPECTEIEELRDMLNLWCTKIYKEDSTCS